MDKKAPAAKDILLGYLLRASKIGEDRRPLHVQFTEMEHSTLLTDSAILRNVNTPDDLN